MRISKKKLADVVEGLSPQKQISLIKQRLNNLSYDYNVSRLLSEGMYEFICVLAMDVCDDLERSQVRKLLLADQECRECLIEYVDNCEELILMYDMSSEELGQQWFAQQAFEYVVRINRFFEEVSRRHEWEETFKNIMRSCREDFIEEWQASDTATYAIELGH